MIPTTEKDNRALERKEKRRPHIESVVQRLREKAARRKARTYYPDWTEAEKDALRPLGAQIKAKAMSYYAACMAARALLPGRTFQATRKKLKQFVNYGTFN